VAVLVKMMQQDVISRYGERFGNAPFDAKALFSHPAYREAVESAAARALDRGSPLTLDELSALDRAITGRDPDSLY
jgi:hypothetical protein